MIAHSKKQKLSKIPPLSNTKQPCIDDAQFDIGNIDNIKDEATWFWNKNTNKTESDLESREKSDIEEISLDYALPRTKEAVSIQSYPKKIS